LGYLFNGESLEKGLIIRFKLEKRNDGKFIAIDIDDKIDVFILKDITNTCYPLIQNNLISTFTASNKTIIDPGIYNANVIYNSFENKWYVLNLSTDFNSSSLHFIPEIIKKLSSRSYYSDKLKSAFLAIKQYFSYEKIFEIIKNNLLFQKKQIKNF
jgi:hypothetical protein